MITENYDLQCCDIFVPHEDHITYIMSTDDKKPGQSLGKEASYYGSEKKYIMKALNVSLKSELDYEKSPRDNLYTENVKNGVNIMTYYMPVLDKDGKPAAIFSASYSVDFFVKTNWEYILELMGISLAVMLVSVIIFYFSIRKHVIKPVTKLTKSVRLIKESVKNGQTVATNIHTDDEFEELATAFEDMNKDLIGYIDENTKITAEKERIDTELNLATNIQSGMLPDKFPAFPDRNDFDIYASMTPAKEVGGDFYDFFMIDENRLGVVMADVSGKGVPAALFMMYSKILLKSYTLMKQSPKAVLEEVNVTVKPATVLPHQALSCNNSSKTSVYDCIPLYTIGFDCRRNVWEWYCVKWAQSYQGKQQSRGVVTSSRGVPQQRIERACLV